MHKYIDVDLLQLVLLPWLNSNTDFGTRSEVCEQEVQVSLKSSTVELATKQNKNKSKPKGEEKSLMSLFPGLWSKVGVIYRMAKWHCKEETITNSIAIFSKPPNPKNAVHSPPQKKRLLSSQQQWIPESSPESWQVESFLSWKKRHDHNLKVATIWQIKKLNDWVALASAFPPNLHPQNPPCLYISGQEFGLVLPLHSHKGDQIHCRGSHSANRCL